MTDQKPPLTRENIIGLARQVADDEIKVLAREADAEHSDVVLTPFLRRFAVLVAERAATEPGREDPDQRD